MASVSDYNKKIASFQTKLLFPAQMATIQKFLQDNKDPSPNQVISKGLLESVQNINTGCLLKKLKSKCDQKIQKFTTNKDQSLSTLLSTFEQDLLSVNQDILEYIEDYSIISLISDKISAYYFSKFMQITRNSDMVKVEDKMKENMSKVGNDLLKFRDKNSISELFSIVTLDEITSLSKILPYWEALNSVFFKIFKKHAIQMLMKIYEEYSAQWIKEFIINKNQPSEFNAVCEEGLIEELEIVRNYTLKVVSDLSTILKKAGDEKLESYIVKRKLLNYSIRVKRLFKESENLIFCYWSKTPLKFLLFIETNILKHLPEIKMRIQLDKLILEKNLIQNFETLGDENLDAKYSKTLKQIAKKVFDKAKHILSVLGNNNYFECFYQKFNDLILKSLRLYCNTRLYKELKKSQMKYMSGMIEKLKVNRINVSELNFFEPCLTSPELIVPSMQKLIIIPNSFESDFIKDLLDFSSKMPEFETSIYTWKKQDSALPTRSLFDILTIPFGYYHVSQIFSTFNLFSELYSSRSKFDSMQKKLGKKLAELIINNHSNCSISLMVFGESFGIAKCCIEYLDSKNFKIIDNLLIFSTSELSLGLEDKLNGKVFNFFLSNYSLTSKLAEGWDLSMKKKSIFGNYQNRAENIDLSEIRIDESNLMKNMSKVVEEVLVRAD